MLAFLTGLLLVAQSRLKSPGEKVKTLSCISS
jgi:hypothetical protein